jgi:hypothetical protein
METVNKGDLFKCELCQGVFEASWDEKDAEEEMKEKFGYADKEDSAIVCEDCYQKLLAHEATV